MKKVFLITATILVVICAVGIFFHELGIGIQKEEKNECIKWQQEAKTFPGYYITEWHKMQCDHYEITIDAPIMSEDAGE